jgi:hypothetical protein
VVLDLENGSNVNDLSKHCEKCENGQQSDFKSVNPKLERTSKERVGLFWPNGANKRDDLSSSSSSLSLFLADWYERPPIGMTVLRLVWASSDWYDRPPIGMMTSLLWRLLPRPLFHNSVGNIQTDRWPDRSIPCCRCFYKLSILTVTRNELSD